MCEVGFTLRDLVIFDVRAGYTPILISLGSFGTALSQLNHNSRHKVKYRL